MSTSEQTNGHDDSPRQPEAEHDRLVMPVAAEEPPFLPFPVVGIGASAGGLEALTSFFKAVPADPGMAFVVVQHLPPDRESLIAEILSRHTSLPLAQVEDGMTVECDHVYVIRPGHTLTIEHGRLHLGASTRRPGHTRPVDDFFKSLAAEQRERAICIVLSGMGSNGASGAQAVKAVGGLCIAQDPDSAQFPSMPRHLIQTGYADHILRPEEIPEVLIGYAQHPYTAERADPELVARREQQHLREILAVLRTRTRHDFTGYKKATILRRIQRRMGLNRVAALGDYAKLLRQSPVEALALCDDMLIHVTGFFRDPEAWEALQKHAIAPLIASREPHSSVRCWVAACATGEEAYTLAMLLTEECERVGKPLDIKIFATDMAERTLGAARSGVYPGGIEAEITRARLERFFERDDAVYRIRQDLREKVVFAPQNILQDPPFSRLDIITCRNLLIYLEPDMQRRVLTLLHFGLREGGALFLGSSETVAATEELFEPLDRRGRIYRRLNAARRPVLEFPTARGLTQPVDLSPPELRAAGRPSVSQLTHRALLSSHVPAAVTVDRDWRVVYFHGDTSAFLTQQSGEPTREVLALTRESVRSAVRTALQRSMLTLAPEQVLDGWTHGPAGRRRVLVMASPVEAVGAPEFFVVSFNEHDEPESDSDDSEQPHSRGELEMELRRVREDLQSTIEELQTTNEEHRAAAEEVMSVNEELQSSNEELETSKEELQSLNEELATVNAQLQAKIDDHQSTTNDLSSLLSSTDIAVIFLDTQFQIRRFTPAARRVFDLISSDIGRPLGSLANKGNDPDLLLDAQRVLETLAPVEREVTAVESGLVYQRRVLPYRTTDNRIEGVVLTYVDVTQRTQMMDALRVSEERVRRLVELMPAAVYACNAAGEITFYNPRAAEIWGTEPRVGPGGGSLCGSLRAWSVDGELVPKDELPMAVALRTGQSFRGHQIVLEQRDGIRLLVIMNIDVVRDSRGHVTGAINVFEDVTERVAAQEARMAQEEMRNRVTEEFIATLSHELRTPLAALMGWSKLLQTRVGDAALLREGLDAIHNSGTLLARLVDDALDSSRIASGKIRLEPVDANLLEIVRQAVDNIRPTASTKRLTVNFVAERENFAARVDRDRIRPVLWNVLTNAVKFTQTGGQVTVALSESKGWIDVRVADNGIGIDPAFLPHVFERFRQYGPSITKKYGGLGLGLAIARQLVELHGGIISAESAGEGRGATFTVRLPAASGGPSGKPIAAVSATPGAANLEGTTVLLVEDDETTQRALALALSQAGATVITAGNAADGLAALEQRRPALLLSDIGLPDMDGYQLVTQLREMERREQRTPVPAIALTAYAREQDKRQALESGFQLHLSKPVDLDLLVQSMRRVLADATAAAG